MTGTAPPLLAKLVDDAGLFPPAELPMRSALARHAEDEMSGAGVLSDRFLCPASRLPELLDALEPETRLALVVTCHLESRMVEPAISVVAGDGRLELAGLEGVAGENGADDPGKLAPGIPCFVEVPLAGEWRRQVEALAGTGLRAKVRCGGARPELFPSPAELAAFVVACSELGVAFKASAGLHHALRYRDEHTGFRHHGFLNLLLGAARAAAGGRSDDVADVLEATEPDVLVAEASGLSEGQAAATRRLFVSYGSCDTREPIEDLDGLGLLGSATAGR